MKRGALVVFEGCDRAGKSTQCHKLVEALKRRGESATLLKFPERSTMIGKIITSYLEMKSDIQDKAVHLLFSANRWEMVPVMQKLLDEGHTLVVDRYAYSGVAFTAAKDGLELNWCKQPDVGLPKPDVVLYLDINLEKAGMRSNFGEERYETQAFQTKVQRNFKLLKEDNWKIVDASQSIEDVHQEILNIVKKEINQECLTTPIAKLWE